MRKCFSLTLFIIIISCAKNIDCEDQYLGEFKLDSSFEDYINFGVFDSLIFKSDMDEELVFFGRIYKLGNLEREFATSCGQDSIVNNYSTQTRQLGFTSPDESHEFTMIYVWNKIDLDTTEELMLCEVFYGYIFFKSPAEEELDRCIFRFLLSCNEPEYFTDIDQKELIESIEN